MSSRGWHPAAGGKRASSSRDIGRASAPPNSWVGYLRVSDRRQAETGDGLSTQREQILRWAELNDATIVAWFEDQAPGTMDHLDKRDGLRSALLAVQFGEAAGIVVARLDRLARDLMTQEFILRDIRGRLKGRVASVIPEESRVIEDGGDPQRVFMRQIFAAVSQYERAMIKYRLAGGRKARALAGKWHGGPLPYGFMVDGEDRLVFHPAEAPIIAQGLTLRTLGVSLNDVGEWFSAGGMRLRKAERWHPNSVKRTLERAAARGLTPAPLSEEARHFAPLVRPSLRLVK